MAEVEEDGVKERADLQTVFALNAAIKLLIREEHLAYPLCALNAGQR